MIVRNTSCNTLANPWPAGGKITLPRKKKVEIPPPKKMKNSPKVKKGTADMARDPQKVTMPLVGFEGGIISGGVEMKTLFGIAAAIAIVLTSFSVPSVAESDSSEYVIVANKDVKGTSINVAALKGIYLREVKTWSNSQEAIIPVDLASENSFYQNLFGKSYVQMQAYWLNMRIKYSIDIPVSQRDPESVKQFIAMNKGAIGFLKNSDLDDRVKVLKLIN